MKRYIIILFALLINESIFGVDFSAADLDRHVRLTDTRIIFRKTEGKYLGSPDSVTREEEYAITWETQNSISYIRFNYTGVLLGKETKGQKKYLIVYDITDNFMFLTLYNASNELVYEIFGWKYSLNAGRAGHATATSELREKNIIYKAENLVNVDKLIPWAEGVSGAGIGEKIIISIIGSTKPLWNGLLVSNGFIDYNRPHLFTENNRIKKIRIHYGNTGRYSDFDILDTPNYQELSFPFGWDDYMEKGIVFGFIVIEIMDVYKGDKWDDTCINLLYVIAG